MKKRNIILISLIPCLVSCSVLFSKKDIAHLSNPKNYLQYTVKFHSITGTNENKYDTDLYLNVTFLSLDELNTFRSIPLEDVSNLDSYPTPLTILQKNSQILNENKFYENINVGDIIKINVSNYQTINVKYTYIAQIEYNSKIYLNIDDGINNIKEYLEEHRSPFFA